MADHPFHVPPEWAPQSALWVGWPRFAHDWLEGLEAAREEAANFIHNASRFVSVKVAVGDDHSLQDALKRGLDEGAELYPVPMGDVWLRDTGPVVSGPLAHAFRFNGWGGKYGTREDQYTAGAISAMEGLHTRAHDFILEGGSIEVDGEGRLLTTRECLLNANRNKDWTEETAERHLKDALGVREVIWLDRGLVNDHTDGHVDNIARFIAPGHMLCQRTSGDDDPQAQRLFEVESMLRKSELTVSTIPSPGRVMDKDGEAVPASHLNFVITNGAVIMPVYDDQNAEKAASTLNDLMPDHEIVPLRADHLLKGGGGAFHCMSCHVPALEVEP
ncbi:MAG: agmatine deiminase family protein [Pseudomonadota bacterium]